jgi:hypothetical protein
VLPLISIGPRIARLVRKPCTRGVPARCRAQRAREPSVDEIGRCAWNRMFFVSVLQRQRRLSEPAQAASAAPLRSGRITSRVWTLPRTQMLFASYERGLPETLSRKVMPLPRALRVAKIFPPPIVYPQMRGRGDPGILFGRLLRCPFPKGIMIVEPHEFVAEQETRLGLLVLERCFPHYANPPARNND